MAWTCDHGSMTRPAGFPDSDQASHWIEDLVWHRQTYKQSKYRWWDNEPILVASEFTGGRHSFTTIGELRELETYRLALSEYALTCQRAMGVALKQARTGLRLQGWNHLSRLLDLEVQECAESAYLATWADPYDDREISNPQVQRIEKMCAGFLFASPLLLAWELRQLWALYQAAENVLEDTLVDLLVELSERCWPGDLARAVGLVGEHGLQDRIERQRTHRGAVGDPRRCEHQVFRPIPPIADISAG